jgi:cobalt-zinc-cadmium efflux system outer membrane protein
MAVAIVGLLLSSTAAAQESAPSQIDLSSALELARANNAALLAAQHEISEAKGNLTTASVLLVNNPRIAARAGQRRGPTPGTTSTFELEVGLQQTFEIGGQRGQRVDRAKADLEASSQRTEDLYRVVDLAVATAFFAGIAAESRVELRKESLKLAERLFEVASKRLERGAGVPLDVNAARIRRAEAKRRLLAARTESRSAHLRLQQLLGLPTSQAVTLQGNLPNGDFEQSEHALVTRALNFRPDLQAEAQQIEAAEAAVRLADAEWWPDISVGVSYGMEEDSHLVMGGIRFALPVFNNQKGQRQRARATARRLRTLTDGRKLAIESELRLALVSYEQARGALSIYDAEVLRAQGESLELLQGAFQAGDIGIPNVIVVQREIIESREGYLNVRLALARARAAVFAAAALPQTTTQKATKP